MVFLLLIPHVKYGIIMSSKRSWKLLMKISQQTKAFISKTAEYNTREIIGD